MRSDANDFWVDPNAKLCLSVAEACFASLKCRTSVSQHNTRYFALPGITLTVDSVGAEVGTLLTAAFAPREISKPPLDADVLVWRIGDVEGTGENPIFPELPTAMDGLGNFNSSMDGNLFIERRHGLTSVYDHKTRVITSICRGVNTLENDLIAKPILRFLMGILQQKGIHLAHAALVGLNGRGLLVTGKGGMGKSTISSIALRNGLSFCGDDFVALKRTDDGIIGYSLYATLLLYPSQIAQHPHFNEHCRVSNSVEIPKTAIILGSDFDAQTVGSLIVDAIAVPQITEQPLSKLCPMSRAAALRALTPTSVFSSPWREVDRARFLMGLAVDLKCFAYHSGSDFPKISDPVSERYG